MADETPQRAFRRRKPREPITVRMAEAGLARIDEVAAGVEPKPTRSDIVRALLAEALSNPALIAAAKRRLRGGGL